MRKLLIIDGKYGRHRVSAQRNEQLMIYALMALDEFAHIYGPFDAVEMHIVQPPLDHIDVFEMSVAELELWRDNVLLPGVAAVGDPNPRFGPSQDACHFCLARGMCRARADHNLQLVREEFGSPCPTPAALTPDEVSRLLPELDQISSWCDAVRAYALQLGHNRELPGYKLVEGRSIRKWTSPEAVIELLRNEGYGDHQLYTRKPIGITEAEKLVGRKHPVFALAERTQGAPTLVPESDPREPMATGAALDFQVETGEQ